MQPILTSSCATTGCHRGATAKAGLDLSAGKAHAALVGVEATQCSDGRLLVEPGAPSESYVMDKITNTDLCSGGKMPKNGTLPSGDAATIANWICGGAPDN